MLPSDLRQEFGSEDLAHRFLTAATAAQKKQLVTYVRGVKRKRADAAERPVAAKLLQSKKIYIDPRVPLPRAQLDGRLEELGASAEPSRERAEVFVVPDVTQPGQRVLWNAALAGLLVVSLPYFIDGQGPVLAYQCALRLRRTVWISEDFRTAHPSIIAIIVARLASASRGAQWTVAQDLQHFQRAVDRCTQQRRSLTEVPAFVTHDEYARGEVALGGKRLTSEAALGFLAKLHRGVSSIGVCKR